MTLNIDRPLRSGLRLRRLAGRGKDVLVMAGVAVSLSACGDFLDDLIGVDAPSRVIATSLQGPENAGLLVNSAGTDLACALAHYVVAGGLVGNELEIATTLIVMKEYDKRDFSPVGSAYTNTTCDAQGAVGVYVPLSVARWQADNALQLLQGWTDEQVANRTELVARAAAYAGFAHVFMGEAMCSVAFDLGPELAPEQVFERAVERFTTGIQAAEAAGLSDLATLSHVGRARALLNLGRVQDAADDARLVPAEFEYDLTYSQASARRENAVFTRNIRSETITIDPSYRGLTFGGVADPRVQIIDTGGPASDGVTALFVQEKYPEASSPIRLGSYEEAQLILAEAALADGDVGEAVAIINHLHERVGLPPFSSSSPDEVLDQIIEERSRELFLDGHHLGDIRRYGVALTPAPGQTFKDGGGVYLDQTCFPLPELERQNNPNV